MLFQGYRNCAVVRLFDFIVTGKRSPSSPALAALTVNSNSSSSSGHTQLPLMMLLLTTAAAVWWWGMYTATAVDGTVY